MSPDTLRTALALADGLRQAQQWADAVAAYQRLAAPLARQPGYHHNLALCLLGAGQPEAALAQADLALAAQPALWQSTVVKTRALKALGRWPEALQLLRSLASAEPQRGEFALELATLALHELCDAHLARQLVQPWLKHPVHGTDAQLTDLMASLYDPTRPGEAGCEPSVKINARAHLFARQQLQPARPAQPPAQRTPARRLRVGLLSPLFQASPVYFFCSGALALLKSEFELVFCSRSRRGDWATEELRAMSAEWHDCTDLDAPALQLKLRGLALDVLVDLGGWMDPIALRALADKPAPRQYKWVGGQSLSTGLHCFDGYLTDDAQTPPGVDSWYTEPLLRLPQGYVSYQPPHYLPAPVPAPTHAHVLGVVANPVKVSRPFLAALALQLTQDKLGGQGLPLVLRFIDRRYKHPPVQARIRAALQPALQALQQSGRQAELEFIAPSSHLDYLRAVGTLSEMLDTFPYTGGLTTIEALSLGVPVAPTLAPREGLLFCERHTLAHQSYLQPAGHSAAIAAKRVARARAQPAPGQPRRSLLAPGCPRSSHAALAASLACLFSQGHVYGQAHAAA